MDELLAKVSDDENTFVGILFIEPYQVKIISPSYQLSIRPLKEAGRRIQIGAAEIILASGEVIPVNVIGFRHFRPSVEMIEVGRWTPRDQFVTVRDTDLTKEQAQQARIFVQRQNGSK